MEECQLCHEDNFLYELKCCTSQCCISCLKSFQNCPNCNRQITKPNIDNYFGNILYRNLPRYIWLYRGMNNGWWIFSYSHMKILEQEYKDNNDSVTLFICGKNIKIVFAENRQYNLTTNVSREIRRINRDNMDQYLIKGLSGMK